MILLIIGLPGWAEIVLVLFVGLLLFGRRLPEVGRSLGKTIVEFKKGIREVENEVNVASKAPTKNEPVLPNKESVPQDDAANKPSAE